MKKISLTQGKFALVDDDDFENISKWNWCAHHHHNDTYYAVRVSYSVGKRMISMHGEILGKKDGYIIDHIDGDGLNNQKSNIRFVTTRQNSHNRRPVKPKTGRYPGVFWRKDTCKWRVMMLVNGKLKHLGQYSDEHEAYLVYSSECKKIGCDVLCSY